MLSISGVPHRPSDAAAFLDRARRVWQQLPPEPQECSCAEGSEALRPQQLSSRQSFSRTGRYRAASA
jgi:hypothetical protein